MSFPTFRGRLKWSRRPAVTTFAGRRSLLPQLAHHRWTTTTASRCKHGQVFMYDTLHLSVCVCVCVCVCVWRSTDFAFSGDATEAKLSPVSCCSHHDRLRPPFCSLGACVGRGFDLFRLLCFPNPKCCSWARCAGCRESTTPAPSQRVCPVTCRHSCQTRTLLPLKRGRK